MWQGFSIYCLALIVCLASVEASVIRQETTSEEPQLSSTTVQPEISTESVGIDVASTDPAPGTMSGDLSVTRDKPLEKSAKLLLLSTPAKRPAEVEQQLEEQDENETAVAGSAEASGTTEAAPEATTTTTTTEYSETTTTTESTTEQSSDHKTTKLFAINATTSMQEEATLATDNATISIAEQPQAAGDNNVAIELALVEPEAEYVVHDSELQLDVDVDGQLERELLLAAVHPATHDDLQLGSFTHIDSDVHLQPVVHSVEIVPTRLDDPLIVNYVHNLR